MADEEKAAARLSFEISDAQELARYAFDHKVEESGMRVLRRRLYPVIAVISILLSSFGVGLTWWIDKVAERAKALDTSVGAAEKRLSELDDEITAFREAAQDLRIKAEQMNVEMRTLVARGEAVDAQSIAAITKAAAAQNSGESARELSIKAQEVLATVLGNINQKSSELDQTFDGIREDAKQSRLERERIQGIRSEAESFGESVRKHRAIVAATVVDSISLRSDDSSSITVPNLVTDGSFTIKFETTRIERKTGFDIFYTVNKGERENVKVSINDLRRPIVIEGTQGQYQFMMEFIYKSRMAPDFVVIRVSAVPQSQRNVASDLEVATTKP